MFGAVENAETHSAELLQQLNAFKSDDFMHRKATWRLFQNHHEFKTMGFDFFFWLFGGVHSSLVFSSIQHIRDVDSIRTRAAIKPEKFSHSTLRMIQSSTHARTSKRAREENALYARIQTHEECTKMELGHRSMKGQRPPLLLIFTSFVQERALTQSRKCSLSLLSTVRSLSPRIYELTQ